ncbi:MAG: helix-turn-helix domain-containing protein [Patescibacteria group bacterium]
MNSTFTKKEISIDQGSVGPYVKKFRESRGMDMEEVSLKTNISLKYLKAIESSSYDQLPKGIYSRIFFKKYIDFLGINHKNILNDFIKEQDREHRFEKNIFFNKIVSWKNFVSVPRVLKNLLIFLLVVVCFFYLYFYLKNIFSAPPLDVFSFENSAIVNSLEFSIDGKTSPESEVFINGSLIMVDSDGNFSEKVFLNSGINFITVSAKKKYSKENIISKEILVEN